MSESEEKKQNPRPRGLRARLGLDGLILLLLLDLEQQRAVDVRQYASEGDGGADQGVQLLVAADGELQVAGRDALDLEVLGGVLWTVLVIGWGKWVNCVAYSCQLEDFGCEVLENGGHVDGGLGADAHLVLGVVLEETLDATAGELENVSAWRSARCANKFDGWRGCDVDLIRRYGV